MYFPSYYRVLSASVIFLFSASRAQSFNRRSAIGPMPVTPSKYESAFIEKQEAAHQCRFKVTLSSNSRLAQSYVGLEFSETSFGRVLVADPKPSGVRTADSSVVEFELFWEGRQTKPTDN